MNVRAMRPGEIDAAVSVWHEANVARGAPHGPERTARIRAKLSAPDALPFVAFRPDIVGMALAEPGRFDDGAGDLDPTLLHISMVFVRPAAQRTGVGLPLVLHVLDVASSMGYQRVGVWTAQENSAARKLYERAGMTPTGKTTPLRSSVALQYECLVDESRRHQLSVDDVADLGPRSRRRPKTRVLSSSGTSSEQCAGRGTSRAIQANRAKVSTTSLSSLGAYVALLMAVGFAGFLGAAIGIWASILWGVGVLTGIAIYGRRRLHQSRSRIALDGQSPSD